MKRTVLLVAILLGATGASQASDLADLNDQHSRYVNRVLQLEMDRLVDYSTLDVTVDETHAADGLADSFLDPNYPGLSHPERLAAHANAR